MRKSLIEQRFLDELLANDTSRLIWILPMGLPGQVPVKWGPALLLSRALWLSPYPADLTAATRETCPALLRSRALWLSPYPEDSPLTAHFHFGVGR